MITVRDCITYLPVKKNDLGSMGNNIQNSIAKKQVTLIKNKISEIKTTEEAKVEVHGNIANSSNLTVKVINASDDLKDQINQAFDSTFRKK